MPHLRSVLPPCHTCASLCDFRQVIDYFEYHWRTVGQSINEKEILDGTPIKMRLELAMAIHRRLIDEVPIFAHLCSKGPRRILVCQMLLRMQPMIAQPSDNVRAPPPHSLATRTHNGHVHVHGTSLAPSPAPLACSARAAR
jgi:hypothetical protein